MRISEDEQNFCAQRVCFECPYKYKGNCLLHIAYGDNSLDYHKALIDLNEEFPEISFDNSQTT